MTTKEEVLAQLDEDKTRVRQLDAEYQGRFIDPESDDGVEWAECNRRIDENETTIEQLEKREQRLAELAENPANREEGRMVFHTASPGSTRGEDIYDLSTVRNIQHPEKRTRELRDRGKRAVERCQPQHPDVDDDVQRANAEKLLKRDSTDGRLSRYLLATGSPQYNSAFGKWLAGNGQTSAFNRQEQMAWEEAQQAERALSLTGASGGFAVPFELDTTILLTSNGATNPIRQIANVKNITVDEWRGLTTTGVTASYAAEATETTDNAPTLVQPTVSTEKAQAWIPFSIEVDMDWAGMRSDFAAVLQDAKDVLEAVKFVSGTGTNEPFGVAVGATNTVNAAAGADAFTLANLYSLAGSLPPRYRANASWLGDLLIYIRIRQFFDTGGSNATVWQPGLQAGLPEMLFGKPIYEGSGMPDDATTGNKFLIFGDFSRYVIAERIGLTVDFIPHVFGAAQRPTGQRGLYCYWRNGAKVIDANAFRALLGTA